MSKRKKIALPSPAELAARLAAAKKKVKVEAEEEVLLPSVAAAQQKQQEEAKRRAREAQLAQARREAQQAEETMQKQLLDPSLPLTSSVVRRPRKIAFVQPGTYAKQGARQRIERDVYNLIHSEQLPRDVQARLFALSADVSDTPAVEPWDVETLEPVNDLVERPVEELRPGHKAAPPVAVPLMLTKKERKRIRREERQHRQEQERAKITLGLIPPPPPKVKLSNMSRVFGSAMVDNPTAVEEKVRAAMRARLTKHLAANEARKLTPEESRAKKLAKAAKDRELDTCVTVYKVTQVSNLSRKKIRLNAQQNHVSGLVVLLEGCNVVLVEGGPKATRKMKKLMMQRMKWNTDDDDDGEEDENVCTLLWEGYSIEPEFSGFEIVEAETPGDARAICEERKGALAFFNFAIKYRGQ